MFLCEGKSLQNKAVNESILSNAENYLFHLGYKVLPQDLVNPDQLGSGLIPFNKNVGY